MHRKLLGQFRRAQMTYTGWVRDWLWVCCTCCCCCCCWWMHKCAISNLSHLRMPIKYSVPTRIIYCMLYYILDIYVVHEYIYIIFILDIMGRGRTWDVASCETEANYHQLMRGYRITVANCQLTDERGHLRSLPIALLSAPLSLHLISFQILTQSLSFRRAAHLELRWQLMLSGRGLQLGHLSVPGGHLQGSLPTWQQHSGHVRHLQVRRHPEQHEQAQVMPRGGEQVPGWAALVRYWAGVHIPWLRWSSTWLAQEWFPRTPGSLLLWRGSQQGAWMILQMTMMMWRRLLMIGFPFSLGRSMHATLSMLITELACTPALRCPAPMPRSCPLSGSSRWVPA